VSAQTEMNREISSTIAFAVYPDRLQKDRLVKRLAERIVGLDLLGALGLADELQKALGPKKLRQILESISL
jgi:hypothetical protein